MSNEHQLTAIVAEDEDLIRSGLIRKIEQSDLGIVIIGEASNGKTAFDLISNRPPQLLITDIRMPVMDGLKLLEEVSAYFPSIQSIITSGYADFEYARQAMLYNVRHYILKPVKTDELVQTLLSIKSSIHNDLAVDSQDPESIVLRVKQYMKDNFTQELNLEKIASSFNFSSAYLSKIFVKFTGEAPSRYLITLRINEAKYLLKQHRSIPIKEIGEQVGYPDPYYFSRIFKQTTGLTPRDYQNKN